MLVLHVSSCQGPLQCCYSVSLGTGLARWQGRAVLPAGFPAKLKSFPASGIWGSRQVRGQNIGRKFLQRLTSEAPPLFPEWLGTGHGVVRPGSPD